MENEEKDLRKLASIQTISEINPIPGADAIECATVLGWKCVVKKGEFRAGDKVVYCEIDSFLPIKEEYEFLRKGCYRKMYTGEEGFRIKTVKLRGQLSQGLIIPVNDENFLLEEGTDVTEDLFIKKYDIEVPAQLRGICKGNFPCFLHKTDEERIQSAKRVIEEFMGKEVYITTKINGSSMTVYKRDENDPVGVCSRNLELTETEDNAFWKVANKYSLKEKMLSNMCIQGELAGPGIQKNKLCLSENDLFIFNVYDIKEGRYLDFEQAKSTAKSLGLKFVPVEFVGVFDFTLEQLLEMAKGKYSGTSNYKEGIVIRPTKETYSPYLRSRLSIKVLNNDDLASEK